MRLLVGMFSLFLNLKLDFNDNLSKSYHFQDFMTEFEHEEGQQASITDLRNLKFTNHKDCPAN